MKRKNPEDGKEESSKSGGEPSLHSGEKNLGTSKVCDPRCVSRHLLVARAIVMLSISTFINYYINKQV